KALCHGLHRDRRALRRRGVDLDELFVDVVRELLVRRERRLTRADDAIREHDQQGCDRNKASTHGWFLDAPSYAMLGKAFTRRTRSTRRVWGEELSVSFV